MKRSIARAVSVHRAKRRRRRRPKSKRPPRTWWRECVAGVRTSGSKLRTSPENVCGELWYHKMSAEKKAAAVARERRRQRRRRKRRRARR